MTTTKKELTKEIYNFLGNPEMRNLIYNTLYTYSEPSYSTLKEDDIPKEIKRLYNITKQDEFYGDYYCFFKISIEKEDNELRQKFYENRIAVEQVMRSHSFKKYLLTREEGTYDSTIEEEDYIVIICTSEECAEVLKT